MTNLAIIGAGIGGCSAAYFAHQLLPDARITIYDSRNRMGGRILTCKVAGANLELGATFFNGFNRILLDIVKLEQLRTNRIDKFANFAVWNGSELVFRSKIRTYATYLKILTRYRFDTVRTYFLLRKAQTQLTKLYSEILESPGEIAEKIQSVGLDRWYSKSFIEILMENGVSQRFVDEILTPITRAIYSQDACLGGLAGLSSLIGVYSGATFSLEEGNSSLPAHLARVSNARIKLDHKVEAIEKTSSASFRLHIGEDTFDFDKVIIATPLELANIKLDSSYVKSWEPQPFQAVYKIVMKGVINPDYFGLKESAVFPSNILTTSDTSPLTLFSIQSSDNGNSLVSVSSKETLRSSEFRDLFKNSEASVLEHCWEAAYPLFKPVTKLPLTQMDKGLVYLSTIEPIVSSMETSALVAYNAVRMLCSE